MRLAIAGSRSLVTGALREACRIDGHETLLIGRDVNADIRFSIGEPFSPVVGLDGFDALVICVASFGKSSIDGMRQNLAINVDGTLQLLKFAADSGVPHVLYLSSVSAIKQADSYGLTKATAERVLSQLCPQIGVKLTIVRPSQIYDTNGAAAHHQPFLYHLLKRVADGRDITIYGTKDVVRNYVHVDDLAHALLVCLRSATAGTFNAVHPRSIRVSELVRVACEVFESRSRVTFDPAQQDLAEVYFPDSDNIFSAFRSLSCRSLAQGLAEVAALWKAQAGEML